MKEIIIIAAPSNLGLIEPSPGVEPGVKFMPEVLEKAGFFTAIGATGKVFVAPPPYTMHVDPESNVRNAEAIINYSRNLADTIRKAIDHNKVPLVVGGDCSVMLGAAVALKQKGNFGLFHLDGHTDYMWPEFSQTNGAAGMGLALVTGAGHEKLTNIDGLHPYIKEENVFCVGNREYDDAYVALSINSNMRYIDLDGIRKHGAETIAHQFLQMVDEKKLDGFWIHFDVDVLNDEIMPCVDSRTEDGLWYDELKEMLNPLVQAPKFIGMEITILDPTLDEDGKYSKQFVKETAKLFKP